MDKNKLRLEDILNSIGNIESFLQNKRFEDINTDLLLQSAIMAQLMILGEAANRISNDFKSLHPNVEWQKATDMRNVLIHEYFGIEWKIVWDTINEDLPKLKDQIKQIQ